MGRIEKQKRMMIEQANRRLLNEQNEKLTQDYIDKMTKSIQGLIPYEVKSGDNISSIVKNSKSDGGIKFLDFDLDLNKHITDPNKIYSGDVIFFMSDPTGIGFRNSGEMDEFMRQEKGIDKGRIDYLISQDPNMFK